MNLKQSRVIARRIEAVYSVACTVPNGHGPDDYFARIWTCRPDDLDANPMRRVPSHPVDFQSWQEAVAWFSQAKEREEEYRRAHFAPRPRSPLDILIDRAVGRE